MNAHDKHIGGDWYTTCSFTENGSPLRRQQDGNTGEEEDGGCHIRSPGGVGFIAAAKSSPFVTYRVHAAAGTVNIKVIEVLLFASSCYLLLLLPPRHIEQI